MKSIQERKLALISKIHQLKEESDKLKRQHCMESQLHAYAGLNEYVCLYVFGSKHQ